MMFGYLGRTDLEKKVNEAVRACLLADEVTPELGGTLTTAQVGDAVLARLSA
jgi:isocitrate/isopropylmalate dehydrogenase